ncbi:MAG: hypothetical protein AAEJ46_08880 [Planctomycetota bacterium]|jgi:hypothetical protein
MNRVQLFLSSTAFSVLLAGCSAEPASNAGFSQERIGFYDSRAIAIAFTGGEVFQETMKEMRQEYEQATAAGDEATLTRIDTLMQERQKLLHAQGFSTAPVDELLEHYSDAIPALLEEAGVSALISKWDGEALSKYPGARRIDMTESLIDLITADPKQRKAAFDILDQDPVPLESLEDHDD